MTNVNALDPSLIDATAFDVESIDDLESGAESLAADFLEDLPVEADKIPLLQSILPAVMCAFLQDAGEDETLDALAAIEIDQWLSWDRLIYLGDAATYPALPDKLRNLVNAYIAITPRNKHELMLAEIKAVAEEEVATHG